MPVDVNDTMERQLEVVGRFLSYILGIYIYCLKTFIDDDQSSRSNYNNQLVLSLRFVTRSRCFESIMSANREIILCVFRELYPPMSGSPGLEVSIR